MRILQGLVGVEAVVLVVLLVLLAQRGDVAPLPSVRSTAGAAHDAPVVAAAELEKRAAPTNELVRVDATDTTGDGTVVLQGRLLGLDPPPKDETVRLSCSRKGASGWARVHGGVYAITGLAPGEWNVRCEVPGCLPQQFEHTLDTTAMQRLDITLVPAEVLPVFVRTTDGERLQVELSKRGISTSLQVLATATPLTGDLAPTDMGLVGDIGFGRHRVDSDANQRADPNAGDGVLELHRPPPLHATLLMRHLVLAEQRITPGQREVRFEVDLARVTARLAKVRLAVRDANGQPVADARVSLSTAQGGGSSGMTAADGIVTIDSLLPGISLLGVWAKDQEMFYDHCTLTAGGTTDLGEIVLAARRTIRGRLVDGDGKPVRGSVTWIPIDLWRPPHPALDHRSTRAEGDGGFALPAAARRYVLQVLTEDGRIGHAIVDARPAAGESCVIVVCQPTTVHLDVSGDAMLTWAVVARNPSGDLIDVSRIEPRWRTMSMRLPPGDYVFEVYDGAGGFVKRVPRHVGSEALRLEVP